MRSLKRDIIFSNFCYLKNYTSNYHVTPLYYLESLSTEPPVFTFIWILYGLFYLEFRGIV
jgi:hypothetical protein